MPKTCPLVAIVLTLGALFSSVRAEAPVAPDSTDAATRQPTEAEAAAIRPLSPQALEALVSGIALYPDDVIAQILDAAQHPAALHQAALAVQQAGGPQSADRQAGNDARERTPTPESINDLAQYPDLLVRLDQHLELTTRLGQAALTQLADVWAAIDRVRAKAEASQQSQTQNSEPAADQSTDDSGVSSSAVYAPYPYPYGAFAAGMLADNVVGELRHAYPRRYYGPRGAVVYNHGNVKAGAAAGSATVVGPKGNTATASGQAAGVATQSATSGGHDDASGPSSRNSAFTRHGGSATTGRYSRASSSQWQQAHQVLSQTWGQIDQKAGAGFARPGGATGGYDALRENSGQRDLPHRESFSPSFSPNRSGLPSGPSRAGRRGRR